MHTRKIWLAVVTLLLSVCLMTLIDSGILNRGLPLGQAVLMSLALSNYAGNLLLYMLNLVPPLFCLGSCCYWLEQQLSMLYAYVILREGSYRRYLRALLRRLTLLAFLYEGGRLLIAAACFAARGVCGDASVSLPVLLGQLAILGLAMTALLLIALWLCAAGGASAAFAVGAVILACAGYFRLRGVPAGAWLPAYQLSVLRPGALTEMVCAVRGAWGASLLYFLFCALVFGFLAVHSLLRRDIIELKGDQ